MNQTENWQPSPRSPGSKPDDPRVLKAVEEYMAAQQAGRPLDRHAFLARHADLAPALAQCLDGLKMIQAAAPLLRDPSSGDGWDVLAGAVVPEVPLGDYRLVREIGRGGMGVVYEAIQMSLGRRVALKVLPFASALDARQLQRFKNEAQAAAQLHHTHIVPVYGVGCERGVHYYAMQLIDGQTLAALIHEWRQQEGLEGPATVIQPSPPDQPTTGFTPSVLPASDTATQPAAQATTQRSIRGMAFFRTAAELAIQAAEALEHAHQMGVIHRDIKPANLLVDRRGSLWVTDFGLAHCRSQSGLTMTGDLVGTLRYMSPEQALAQRGAVDQRSDVYSLGVTLYEVLTLTPAFGGSDREELLRQITFEEPRAPRRINKAIPAELETIVLKAMAKNPDERYSTAGELADDLRRYLEDRPITARRPTLAQRARKWARRHKPVVMSAAAALVVVLAVLAGSVGWIVRDQAARRTEATHQVQDRLATARALLADGQVPQARQKLAEARSRIGDDRALVGAVADEVEALDAELATFERFLALDELAHEAEFSESVELRPRADGVGGMAAVSLRSGQELWDPHRAVPYLLEALSCYGALEQEDWSDQLEGSLLGPQQVARVRRTAYERLLWLADQDLRRKVDHRTGRKVSPKQAAQQALVYLGRAENAFSRTFAFYEIRARCHKALGEEGAARRDEAKARQTPGTIALDHYLLALAATGAYNKAEAVRQCEAALRLEPTHYWSLLWLGFNLTLLGSSKEDDAAAVGVLTGCILKRPDHAYAYGLRGEAYHRLRRFKEAEADYRESLRLRPDYSGYHTGVGLALEAQGKHAEAEKAFRQAIRLETDDPAPRHGLGNALSSQGKYAEAEKEQREALRLQRNILAAYINLGNALLHQGMYAEAERSFLATCNNLGNALLSQGKYADAEKELRAALRLRPDYPGGHVTLGNALSSQGKHAEAEKEYREALRLRPDFPAAYVNLGNVLSSQGKHAEAEKQLRTAVRLQPDFPEAHYNLGAVLRQQGKYDAAEKEYREALRLRPNYPDAHLNLGNVLLSQGKHGEAMAAYREALRQRPDSHRAQGRSESCRVLTRWPAGVLCRRRQNDSCLECDIRPGNPPV
jgi:serine/threonine protein kinase/tetratricopeptide (TPR) repeat protein